MTASARALPGSADILVAGSGAAGLTAALSASAGGGRVLVIERAREIGGTSAFSGGRVWVPGNHYQEEAGEDTHAARAYLDCLISAEHADMTDAFLRSAPAMARFVEARSPHRFVPCPSYPDYHPSLPGATPGGRCLDMQPLDTCRLTPLTDLVRTPPAYVPMTHAEWEHWRYPGFFDWELMENRLRRGIRTNGVALVAALLAGVIADGADVVTGARLIRVVPGQDSPGWLAEVSVDGATQTVQARSVILATGGFDWDAELRARHHPGPQRATGAPPGNTGDGLRIAQELGAATANLAEGWWMPMAAVPGEAVDGHPYYRSLIRERAVPRQIIVNSAGRRFADEAMPYNDFVKAMHQRCANGAYANDPAYLIFDNAFRRRYPLPGLIPGEETPNWYPRAGSLSELAQRVGIEPAGLTETVARWNRASQEGVDLEFGRGGNIYDRYCGDPHSANPNLGPLTEPPFYALRVLAGTIGTKGGPVTDTNGVVLRSDGQPVTGLYAVGNASAFWVGDAYPAPGATLGIAMTMGYLAGRHAAQR